MDKELLGMLSNLAQQVAFPILTAAYFMFRDYRQGQKLNDSMEKVATNLAVLTSKLEDR